MLHRMIFSKPDILTPPKNELRQLASPIIVLRPPLITLMKFVNINNSSFQNDIISQARNNYFFFRRVSNLIALSGSDLNYIRFACFSNFLRRCCGTTYDVIATKHPEHAWSAFTGPQFMKSTFVMWRKSGIPQLTGFFFCHKRWGLVYQCKCFSNCIIIKVISASVKMFCQVTEGSPDRT